MIKDEEKGFGTGKSFKNNFLNFERDKIYIFEYCEQIPNWTNIQKILRRDTQ